MIHLDDIYRKRFQFYYLTTGEVADSRRTNWRQVDWEKVISIETCIRGNKFIISCNDKPTFKFFLNFRWAGQESIAPNKYREIRIWTVGWSDGDTCYLTDYDFKMGNQVKEYTMKLSELKSHIHPRIINLGII